MKGSLRDLAARGGGNMFYEKIAALNQLRISSDTALDTLGSSPPELLTPAPDRSSSTR
jgi:hypothetical protein